MVTATRTRTRRTLTLWTSAAVLLAGVFYVVHKITQTRLPIRTGVVVRGSLSTDLSNTGKVEPFNNFEAHAPFPGLIRAVHVHEGEKVPAGKLLVTMNDADARAKLATALSGLRAAQASYDVVSKGGSAEERISASAELNKALADRDQAARDLAALKKLQATGAASASEVAAAQQRLTGATTTIQNLQQRQQARVAPLDLAHAQAALDEARTGYEATKALVAGANVISPFAGTVYSLPVSPTEFVQMGDRLLQMADLSKVQVRAYFDEPEIGRIAVGQPATIKWEAKPDHLQHGHILRVPSTIVGYGTRNVGEVLVSVDDADGTLLPSTNVTVRVTTMNKPDVLIVPREALYGENGKNYVYVVRKDTLRRVQVRVGETNLTQVEILSGLEQGQVVALGTTNGTPILEGVPVTVMR